MTKASNASQDWIILNSAMDVHNPAVDNLSPNQPSGAPYSSGGKIDLLSNGFKMRATGTMNSNQDYIYAAFAENPFGGNNVSPANAR